MKDWLTDEEQARRRRRRWWLRVEAWTIGLAYGAAVFAWLRGWLAW